MIKSIFKELLSFLQNKFSYVVFLSLFLTPATMLDYKFEKGFEEINNASNFVLASLMDFIKAIISFMVVSYAYIHLKDKKKFQLKDLVVTSLKKLYPTISAYLWVIIFMILPFFIIWILSDFFADVAIFSLNSLPSLSHFSLVDMGKTFGLLCGLIVMAGLYISMKVSFVIFFSYKTGDAAGITALKKCFKINFADLMKFLVILIIYGLIYSLLLFLIGYIIGVADSIHAQVSYVNLLKEGGHFLNWFIYFVVTLINIPFQIIYVEYASRLYKKYT